MNSVLKGHHVDDIYEALNLEDPILFALKQMGRYALAIQTGDHLRPEEFSRRSGKTTRICALAISDLLKRKDVLIRTANVRMSHYILDTLRDMIERLDLNHIVTTIRKTPVPQLCLEDYQESSWLTVSATRAAELGVQVDKVYSDEMSYRHYNDGESPSHDSIFLRRNNK